MRQLTAVLASVLFAVVTAVGLSVATPVPAHAADGGFVNKCGGGKIFLNTQEKASLGLHNKIRKQHRLNGLCVNPALQRAARAHSKDMIQRNYFAHNTKGGSNFESRVRKFGYRNYRLLGENLYYGSGSLGDAGSAMNGWMHSRAHRPQILNGRFREIGIGTYTGTFQRTPNVTMYTADFGTR